MPGSSTQLPGASNVSVMQFQLNNPDINSITLTSLTLTGSGSGNDATGITSVSLYVDNNGNGIVDGGDTLIGTSVYSANNGTATINFTNIIPPSSTNTYLVTYNFSPSAAPGNYVPNINNVTDLVGTNVNGPVNFNGAPLAGASISIAAATFTPTNTFTNSFTPTVTSTPTVTRTFTGTNTPTVTGTFTFVNTPTLTPTFSPTFTRTFTATLTPKPDEKPAPIVYPNPSDGTKPINVHVPGLTTVSNITVQIFTTAFRKVLEQPFTNQPVGVDVNINLSDNWGAPMASGIYYVVVTTPNGRIVGKLLLLR